MREDAIMEKKKNKTERKKRNWMTEEILELMWRQQENRNNADQYKEIK